MSLAFVGGFSGVVQTLVALTLITFYELGPTFVGLWIWTQDVLFSRNGLSFQEQLLTFEGVLSANG